ncbi:molybdopterin-dependent oxidoreductase [Halorussus pelagicus]|uniref:molybdopterin-dependent oxidoreductase n=1 Tax=Halorussus pelagicus TaxID=2505977 RepID=UPI000FFBE163|nr:molybdopterin-dependent oxidoreductase [Halorussus pelagicus]
MSDRPDAGGVLDRRDSRGLLASTVVAGAAGVAGVAGSYAAVGRTPAFVAAPISEVVVASTPDAVVAWSIQTLGNLGAQLGFLLALALTVGLFALTTAVAALLADRFAVPPFAVAPVACVAVALALTGSAVSTLAAGAGAGLVVALASLGVDRESETADSSRSARRRVLQAVAGAFAVGGVGAVLGTREGGDVPDADGEISAGVQSLLDEAGDKSLDVDGIEPLVSEQFYQVDINNVDPTPDREDWTLSVTGAVEEEVEFDYDDLAGMNDATEHRFVTLRCVGERLNGKKMDTALWTGVPVMDLLDSAGIETDECCVMLRAADDYFEEFPLSALEDGFLAFEMNGEALPRGHGYPVRALIPGHWGEINVKWLTEIEVLEEEAKGYWEKRGWHGTGPVNTVAKLHTVNRLGDAAGGGTEIQVGGHAYAGTRGIRRVEVSTDGGDSWSEATLSERLPAEDAWRQWEYTYEAAEPHEVVVRATDGEGDLQPSEETNPFPSGPSGWVSKRVEP